MHTLETSHENVYRISNQIEFDLLLKRVIGLVHLMYSMGEEITNKVLSRKVDEVVDEQNDDVSNGRQSIMSHMQFSSRFAYLRYLDQVAELTRIINLDIIPQYNPG